MGQVVRCQHLLVQVVADGVVGLGGQDEVGGDKLRALVDQLEKGVLRVGAWLAEEDRACGLVLVSVTSTGHLSWHKKQIDSPVVYLAGDPSLVTVLPFDSIESC